MSHENKWKQHITIADKCWSIYLQ